MPGVQPRRVLNGSGSATREGIHNCCDCVVSSRLLFEGWQVVVVRDQFHGGVDQLVDLFVDLFVGRRRREDAPKGIQDCGERGWVLMLCESCPARVCELQSLRAGGGKSRSGSDVQVFELPRKGRFIQVSDPVNRLRLQ